MKKSHLKLKKSVSNFLSRVLVTIIIFLSSLIACRQNVSIKDMIKKHVYTESFHFSKAKKLYNKYFGKYIGEEVKDRSVFTEKISYLKENKYNDGVKLTVQNNYLVPTIESGIVIFIGEKENLGHTIIVEGTDGVDIWYSNVDEKDIKLYDYVEKGKLIGECKDDKMFLFFQKDGKFLDYKKFI